MTPLKAIGLYGLGAFLAVLFFYAVVGIACLHMTSPAISNETQCDRIKEYEDGSTVCEVIMRDDENIIQAYVPPKLIPLSEPNEPNDIMEYYLRAKKK